MSSHRLLRVGELLKREIGEAIRREMPVAEAGLVSVNDVEVAGDLKSARVFLSILGSSEQQRAGVRRLEQIRPRIQDLIAKSVVLKYTPRLTFVMDESIARGNRVLRILDELEKQEQPSKPDGA
jgi:ribosome-binding factor A